jgi:hypothetical protein
MSPSLLTSSNIGCDFQKNKRNFCCWCAGGAGGAGHRAARTDVRDDRAPPQHHQGQRPDLRGGAGQGGGGGHAPAAAGAGGRLPPAARPAGGLEVDDLP